MTSSWFTVTLWHTVIAVMLSCGSLTGDPLHSRAACTQPCNVYTQSRAHCSPGARLCEQWGHGCVNNGARLCASARLCRGSPVSLLMKYRVATLQEYSTNTTSVQLVPYHWVPWILFYLDTGKQMTDGASGACIALPISNTIEHL